MSRRHFGSVRKLPSGRYQVSYWHEGYRHAAPHTFVAKAEAQGFLSSVETDIQRGSWIDPRLGRVTLAAWSETWLSGRTDLRPATRAKYRYIIDRHLLPALGGCELTGLRPSLVRDWYMGLRGRYVSVADDAYRMLRAILTTAVTDELIPRNPCRVKGAGQSRSAERPVASIAEVTAAVAATPQHHRLAILLPAWCQLRRGEVLGLQRGDVDLLHRTLRIERAVVRPTAGPLVIGPPKTSAGRRTISIPENILPALQTHLEKFVGPQADDWLFTAAIRGPMAPSTIDRIWVRARRSIGRPDLRYHDLRHSGLTWSAATGASVAELMRRGGHANPTAALRYQHATEDRDRAIAKALARLATAVPFTPTTSRGVLDEPCP
jgi:integrase